MATGYSGQVEERIGDLKRTRNRNHTAHITDPPASLNYPGYRLIPLKVYLNQQGQTCVEIRKDILNATLIFDDACIKLAGRV